MSVRRHAKWIPFRIPWLIVLIGLEKTVGALIAAFGAVGAFWIHVQHITDPLAIMLPSLDRASLHGLVHGIDLSVARFALLHASGLGLGLACWAVLLGAEATGIWLHRPWGELLVIVETASFLPVEVWGLIHQVHIGGVLTLIVNGLVLFYLTNRYARRRVLLRGREAAPGP